MRKISDIYKEYKIMPNLQMHMLRVAAVASLICDNFGDQLPKEEIITACLLHDMGNIIKSDFDFLPDHVEPEGRDYWQSVKEGYIKKYGNDEHEATVQILKELNVPSHIISYTDQGRFTLMCKIKESGNMSLKIMKYSDLRASPYGIVSYEARMDEAKARYKVTSQDKEDERQRLVACGKDIEQQIFAKCKIKPEDITDEAVASILTELKNTVIK